MCLLTELDVLRGEYHAAFLDAETATLETPILFTTTPNSSYQIACAMAPQPRAAAAYMPAPPSTPYREGMFNETPTFVQSNHQLSGQYPIHPSHLQQQQPFSPYQPSTASFMNHLPQSQTIDDIIAQSQRHSVHLASPTSLSASGNFSFHNPTAGPAFNSLLNSSSLGLSLPNIDLDSLNFDHVGQVKKVIDAFQLIRQQALEKEEELQRQRLKAREERKAREQVEEALRIALEEISKLKEAANIQNAALQAFVSNIAITTSHVFVTSQCTFSHRRNGSRGQQL